MPNEQPVSVLGKEAIHFKNFFAYSFSGAPGQDAKAHYTDYEYYYKAYNATNLQDQLTLFRRCVSGTARSWFDAKSFSSIKDLKTQFLRRFGGALSSESCWKIFAEPKYDRGEDLDVYAAKLKEAAVEIGINDQEKIKHQFLKGLPYDLRCSAMNSMDKSLEVIIADLTRVLEFSAEPKKVSFGTETIHNLSNPFNLTPSSKSLVKTLQSEISDVKSVLHDMRASGTVTSENTASKPLTAAYGDETESSIFEKSPVYRVTHETRGRPHSPHPRFRDHRARSASPHLRGHRYARDFTRSPSRSPSRGAPRFQQYRTSNRGGEMDRPRERQHPDTYQDRFRDRNRPREWQHQGANSNTSKQSDRPSDRQRADRSFDRRQYDHSSRPPRTRFCNHCKEEGHVWQNCGLLQALYGQDFY